MLEINKVNKFFGGLKAVHNASMKVEMGSITGLIGPNGAGKTTLFNTIAGLYDPDEGNIILNNEDISFLKPHELFTKGVLRTFQIAHEFSTLTVLENLMGIPYKWGGKTSLGFDCSGLVQSVLEVYGFKVPRDSKDQWTFLKYFKI